MMIIKSCFNIYRLYAMFANDMPGSSAVSACLAGLSFPAREVIPRCEGHSVAASAVPAVGCKARVSAESREALPQPQGECCRPSPLTQPGLPSHAPSACIPRVGKLAHLPGVSKGLVQPTLPPPPCHHHSLRGGIHPAPRGLTQGTPTSVGEAAGAPQAHAGEGSAGDPCALPAVWVSTLHVF